MHAALLAALAVGCAPSRPSLFEPVRAAVAQRTGLEPSWRPGIERPPAVARKLRELLAAPLTPDSAALVAVLASAELQAMYEDLAAAGAAVTAARTPPNPEVEAELQLPLEDGGHTRIELSALQSVNGLLATIPRAGAADADLRATRRELVARTVELAARARLRLYDAAAAEQRLALRRTVAEAAATAAELAQKLHDAGNTTDLDLLRETLFREDAELALRRAERDALAAREALNATLGLSGAETGWKLAGELLAAAPRLEVKDLEGEAVGSSLELEALRWRIKAAGGRLGVARFDSFVPHLAVGAAASREEGSWNAGPAVGLSLPIFDWGQARRDAASAGERRLRHRLLAVETELRAAARAARETYVAAEEELVRFRDRLLPLRERLIDESVRQYNAMNLGPFELLALRREQIDLEERHIEALRAAASARVAVETLRAGARPPATAPATTTTSPAPAVAGDGH